MNVFRSSLPLAVLVALASLLGCRGDRPRPDPIADRPMPAGPRVGKLALLVGVTKYDHGHKPLKGPGNDVALFRRVLMNTFGFPAGNIVALTENEEKNGRPTRENIRRAFAELAEKAQAGDQVAILLAGHGSEQPDQVPPDPDDPEPNGMDQVFLPADAGQPDLKRKVIPNAIIDDELRVWLKAITDKGARVFLVADCCHSGTLLRGPIEEGVRGILAEQLWPAEVIEEARQNGMRATGGLRGDSPPPSPFKLEKQSSLVALYACQPEQRTYEFPLPDEEAGKHGLLTWTVCQLLSQAGSPLTYRELARQTHESIIRYYEDSGRPHEKMPIPFAEGEVDREVLGEKSWPGRSQLVLLDQKGGRFVNGGKLHGLYPGTILAVYPPAGDAAPNRVLGHVRIVKSDSFTSAVEPCDESGKSVRAQYPDGARVRPTYLVYDLKSLRVFLDDVSDADRRLIQAQLQAMSADPGSLVQWVKRPERATWAIRPAQGKLWLLPASADVQTPASSRFELPREALAATLAPHLNRIARVQNLLAVASVGATETAADGRGMRVDVEIRKVRNDKDGEGTLISGSGRLPRLRAGERIRYRIHNRGMTPVDVTLLVVSSNYRIWSAFPEKLSQTNNRVPPAAWIQTDALQISSDTLGLEHLVALAVEGTGRQQVDFAWLEEENWDAARGARRGSEAGTDVLQHPIGKLFAHALFRKGQMRGAGTAEHFQMRLLSWQTLPPGK
jgi:uncharacterized caspase-like protein